MRITDSGEAGHRDAILSQYQKISNLQKKRPERIRGPPRDNQGLERQLGLDLNQAWRGVATQKRSKDRSRRTNGGDDRAELRVGNVAHRLIEVGVIEQVEELQSDSNPASFPMGDLEVLHHSQVGIEVLRPIELVTPLAAETSRCRREHRAGQAGSRNSC